MHVSALVLLLACAGVGVPRALTLEAAGGRGAATAAPFAATHLVITSINGGANPVAGTAFTVTVEAQDATGTPTAVTSNTNIQLSKAAGTGTLGGTLTGRINRFATSTTVSNVTYTTAESGVQITATRTSGNVLSPGTSAPFTVDPGAATQLVFSGQPTNTVAAATIDGPTGVKVEVRDANGNVVTSDTSDVKLVISTNPGGGILSGTTTVTAIAGIATFADLSIDKTGNGYRLTASSTPPTSTPASSTFNITAGPASRLAITSPTAGTTLTAVNSFSVTVQAQDAGGNAANVTVSTGVQLSLVAGSGPLGGTLTGTIPNGSSSMTLSGVTYTKAEAGVQIGATRTSGNTLTAATSEALTVTPGTASQLVVISVNGGSNPSVGNFFFVGVRSQDANGNPANVTAQTTVILSLAAGSGALGGTLTGTISNGANTATFSAGVNYTKAEGGVQILAHRTSGQSGLADGTSAPFTVDPGAPSQLFFSAQPTNTVAVAAINSPTGVKVQVLDAYGNLVTNQPHAVTLSLDANPGGGTLSGTTTVITTGGVAAFTSLNIDKVGAGYTLRASSSPPETTPSSAAFNITSGPVAQVDITQVNGGSDPTAGTAFSVVVTAEDAGGNPANVATATGVTLSRAMGNGTLGGTITGTIAVNTNTQTISGVTYTLAESGVVLGVATTSGPSLAGGTSQSFTVGPGAATQLAFSAAPLTAAATTAINSPTGIRVEIQDANGNRVTSDARDVTLAIGTNPAGGVLSGTVTVAAVAGVATFTTLSIDRVGTGYTLVASSSPVLTIATSPGFDITVGAADHLTFTVEPTTTTSTDTINGAGGIKVEVRDVAGNLVSTDNRSVRLAIGTNPPGTGTLSGATTVTASGGVATFDTVGIDKVGTGYTLTATSTPALTGDTSATFNITLGLVSRLGIASVNGGSSPVAGAPFQVTVEAEDAGGNPTTVTGTTDVILSVTGTSTLGGTIIGTIPNGASSTVVSGATYTTAELVTLTAAVTGGPMLTAGTSGAFAVVPDAATQLVFGGQPSTTIVLAPINGSGGITVDVRDTYGNLVTSDTRDVTLAIGANPGGGTLGGTTTVAAAGGVARFTTLSIDKVATGYTLTAGSSPALTSPTSAAFDVTVGAADHLTFTVAPTTTVAAATINGPGGIVVDVRDAGDNLVSTDTRDVTLAIGSNPGGGALTGTKTAAAAGGVATFSTLSIDKAGTGYTLSASAAGLTSGTSPAFSITVGPASRLALTSINGGSSPTAGTAFAVVVQAQDAGANPANVTSASGVVLSRGAGTGALGGTLTGTIAAGTNSTSIIGATYDRAEGGVTIVATQTSGSPTLAAGTSASVTVNSGAASRLVVLSVNGGGIHPIVGVAFPVVVQSQDASGNPANAVSATGFTVSRAAGAGALGGTLTGTIAAGASAATLSAVTYSAAESGVMLAVTRTSGDALAAGTSAAFTVNPFAAQGVELLQNPDFADGTTGWQMFEVPDVVSSVVGGVLQFFKASPTTTASGVASVFQETNQALLAGAPVLAQFDLGNSTAVRKRVSVVVADGDLSGVTACTFELPAGAALRTYRMQTHTTKLWANASIRFYAEDAGDDGGSYLLDNVSVKYLPLQSALWTACVDPTAPATPSGIDSGTNLLTNGTFATGSLAPWTVTGSLTTQIAAAGSDFLLQVIRPTATTPPAVVLQGADTLVQNTGEAMVANQILTATLQLGNSSTVRKRVTVRLHDFDLSDQTACTFWVPPGQGPLTYTMRGFTTQVWANATVSIVPETAGSESWIQVDNLTLRRTGTYPVVGTECVEPVPGVAGGIAVPGGAARSDGAADVSTATDTLAGDSANWIGSGGFARTVAGGDAGAASGWRVEGWTPGRAVLLWAVPIDLTAATSARLDFRSWLSSSRAAASGVVQVSVDGVDWQTVATVPATAGWTDVAVDLAACLGRAVFVRFVYDASAPGDGVAPDVWRIDGVVVATEARRHRIP